MLITISPIILVLFLARIFFPLWVSYVRSENFFKMKYAVLEITLPKETFKSPAAMEAVLHAVHNTSDGSWFAQFWKGETRPWYSLEIISIGGQVKFIAWTEDRRKLGLMAAFYAQYPDVEIKEIEDYSKSVHFDPDKIRLWSNEFEFTKPDPYPIKTYVDYGLDKDPKEEYKVDPLSYLLEFLGTIGPNQQVWFQIMLRAHKKEQITDGHWFKQTDKWHDEAEKLVNKLMLRDKETKVAGVINPDTGFAKLPSISKGEQEIIEAIERSVMKISFDVGVRAVYIAPKDSFDTVFGVGGVMSSIKHFSSEHLNGFKPAKTWHSLLDDPWKDFKNIRRTRYSKEALDYYRRRSYFYVPAEHKPLVLNTEELATMWHFPGSVARTPSLSRVVSKKSEAPSNLPS